MRLSWNEIRARAARFAEEWALARYFPGLKEYELPRYLLVGDFQTFELFDLEENTTVRFSLQQLSRHVEDFSFILGVQKRTFRDQDR
jgi:hypothetical protein